MAVKYQPGSGKGWNNFPGYVELSRMREDLAKQEAGVDKEQQERISKDEKAEAEIRAVQQKQEANLKEIYIEDTVSAVQERALNVNKGIQQQIDQNKLEQLKQKTALESIIEFAPSAIKSIDKIQKADWDATQKASTEYYLNYGLTSQQKFEIDALENHLYDLKTEFDETAQEMIEEGFSSPEVMYVRHKGDPSKYGELKARAIIAGKNFETSVRSALMNNNITDPSKAEAFISDYSREYLKAHGLYTHNGEPVSAEFLAPTYEEMSNVKSKIIGNLKLNKAVSDSKEISKGEQTKLIASLDELPLVRNQAANNQIEAWGMEYKNTNGELFTKPEVTKMFFEQFLDVGTFPEKYSRYIYDLLHELPFPPGGTYCSAHPLLCKNTLDARERNLKLIKENKKRSNEIKQNNELDRIEELLRSEGGWNRDIKILQEHETQFEKDGFSVIAFYERFGRWFDESAQSVTNGSVVRQNFLDKLSNRQLTVEEVTDPTIPPGIITDEQLATVYKLDRLLKGINYKDDYKKTIERALKGKLRTEQISGIEPSLHYTYEPALLKAEVIFKNCILNNGSAQGCRDELLIEIDKKDGEFEVVQDSEDTGAKNHFKNFLVTKQRKEKENIVIPENGPEYKAVLSQVDNVPNYLHNHVVIDPKIVVALEETIERGLKFQWPPILEEIVRDNPFIYKDPSEVLRIQTELMMKQGLLDKEPTFDFDNIKLAWIQDPDTGPEIVKRWNSAQTNEEVRAVLEESFQNKAALEALRIVTYPYDYHNFTVEEDYVKVEPNRNPKYMATEVNAEVLKIMEGIGYVGR